MQAAKHLTINWLKRDGCCVLPHLPEPSSPLPTVGLQRGRLWVDMVSLSPVCPPTLQWRWSSTLCVRHAWPWLWSAEIGPDAVTGVDFDYWLHRLIRIQQNTVNKWISKGRKTNPNVLFKVRIFELHLTSLVQINFFFDASYMVICYLLSTVKRFCFSLFSFAHAKSDCVMFEFVILFTCAFFAFL